MKFKTKVTALIATLSLFFGGVFSLNNTNVKEVKAAEFTPTYDTSDSYAVIKETSFNALTSANYTKIKSIRFTTNLTPEELESLRIRSGSRIYEGGSSAVRADGTEFKTTITATDGSTNEFYIPVFIASIDETNRYECVLYSPVAKIYAPTNCSGFFSDSIESDINTGIIKHKIWTVLESITFEEGAFVTTNVTTMATMFMNITIDTLDLSTFNCPNLTNVKNMFAGTDVRQLVFPTEGFAPNLQSTEYMFNEFNKSGHVSGQTGQLESYDFLKNLDTSSVTSMKYMFYRAHPVVKDGVAQPLDFSTFTGTNFTTANVENMSYMFSESYFPGVNLTGLDSTKLTDMNNMFRQAWNLEDVTFADNWGAMCTNMSSVFYQAEKLNSVDMSKVNTESATTLNGMFFRCSSLENVILPADMKTSNVTDMRGMFRLCTSLKEVDLSTFEFSDSVKTDYLLGSCSNLVVVHTPTAGTNGKSISLPSQFSTYAGISAIDENTDKATIDIIVEYFIANWEKMRTSGEASGMCGTLVEGSTAQQDYSELLEIYNMASDTQKATIDGTQDTSDGTTIGETMQYLQNVKEGNQTTEGDYGIETPTQTGMSVLSKSIDSSISLVIIISILSVTAISGYYVISKRKHA